MKSFGDVACYKTPWKQRILIVQDNEHGYSHIEKDGNYFFLKGYDDKAGFYFPLDKDEVADYFEKAGKEFRV